MKKLTAAFLVLAFILTPVLAVAQTGAPKPGSSPSTAPGTNPRPPGTGTPGDPSASPSGTDRMSQHTTKAACEKAGGMWTESSKSCKSK
jgi:hypothetical protein